MSLILFEGFENCQGQPDLVALRNSNISSILTTYYSTTTGRFGAPTRAHRGNSTDYVKWFLTDSYVSGVVGFAMRTESSCTPTYDLGSPVLALYKGGTNQLQLHGVGNEFQVYRYNIYLGTTVGANLGIVWNYYEMKFLIDNGMGYIKIAVNGDHDNLILDLTGIDTQYGDEASIDEIRFGGLHNEWTYMDDFYFCDLTGAKNNDFLGEVRIDAIRPNGAGTHTDFTPSAGSNYENVDDSPYPDDDTTYNDGSNVGDKDSYAMESLSTLSSEIFAVKSQITVKKSDTGTRACKLLTKVGSTEELGDEFTPGTSYLTPFEIYEDNPDDSAAWEDADIDSLEVGVEVTT